MKLHIIETSPNGTRWTPCAVAVTEQEADRKAEECRYEMPMCRVRVTAGTFVEEPTPRTGRATGMV